MGKKGPCHHCGIDSTPMWRNGPPDKPVLCNACGSRYRLWGSLESYIPKHALPLVKPKNLYSGRANDHIIKHTHRQFPLGSTMSSQGKLNPISSWTTSSSPPIPSKKRSETLHERLKAIDKFKMQIRSCWIKDISYEKKNNKKHSSASSPPEEDVLITQKLNSHMVPSNEIGLGGMLLNVTSHLLRNEKK